jgi:hypothetical protein
VQTHYDRASALCLQLGSPRLFVSLWGLWLLRWGRGSLKEAEQVVVGLQNIAGQSNDSGVTLQACHAMWSTCFSTGRFEDTVTQAARGNAIYDIDQHATMAAEFGSHDPATCGLNFSARALALMGRLDDAARQSDAAIALARKLGHSLTLAQALFFAATVYQEHEDVERTRTCAATAATISQEHGFRLMHAWSAALEGWSLVQRRDAAGIEILQRAIASMRAAGAMQFVTCFLGLPGGAQLRCDRIDDARTTVEEAIALVDKTGERFYHAELLRLSGALIATEQGAKGHDAAARQFDSALRVAREQGAALLELRTTTSMARLSVR